MSYDEQVAAHLLTQAAAMGGWLSAYSTAPGDLPGYGADYEPPAEQQALDALAEAGLMAGDGDRYVLTDVGWDAVQALAEGTS